MMPRFRSSRSVRSRITSIAAVIAMVAAGAVLTAPAAAAATETHYHPDGVNYTYDPGNPAAGATAVGCSSDCPDPMYIPDSFHVGNETYKVVAIGSFAFQHKGLTQVGIGNNVEVISVDAFLDNQLESVEIPPSVKTIEPRAFYNNHLRSVTIPDSVDIIGDSAFLYNNLTSVTIGDSVTKIDRGAFDSNPGLTSVVFTGPAPTVYADSDTYPSFDTSSGSLVLMYASQYGASEVAGGYTSPTWKGYDTEEGVFPDVHVLNVHFDNIVWLSGQGITKPADGNYHPTNEVTRGSMTAFLFRLTHPGKPSPKCTGDKPFPDVKTSNVFCGYIQWAVNNGVTKGYPDGLFRPGNGVTRGAMAALMQRVAVGKPAPKCAKAPFDDVAVNSTFCKPISWMVDNGITYGVGDGSNYGTTQIVNRQSMASFLHRIYNYMH